MQTGGFPLACGDFPNGRQLDVIHALGQLEEGRHRRIGEQQNPAARHLFEEVAADGYVPPQVAQSETVLRINSYPWTVCIIHGHFASCARNLSACRVSLAGPVGWAGEKLLRPRQGRRALITAGTITRAT